ncbi:sterile alpha motif domain-containing protein 9 [Parambassis ranga]|uniref:Sterile alpha motif domain-containing protein 9 n=1 Tax=Parambassis ranga TaxID=210632 RepID=A0A6P7HZK7_9TELE|nr:sterile alpha motif domain-containing protein 9-like [Parambassis ranga]
MANGLALSTAKGAQIYVDGTFIDSLSLLYVLHPNQCEGSDANLTEQIDEENFYRGAPPSWLNFHMSEQVQSHGSGAPIVKRDGYETLKELIQKKRKLPGISTVKLFHQSGCGGTTLAMQVLWDLRKTFRCAVLTGSTSDTASVANQVVDLFTAGSRDYQNTVLLLVEEDQKLENLPESILEEIANQNIVTHMPPLILLSCIRKSDHVIQQMEEALMGDEQTYVIMKKTLSDREMKEFNLKNEELRKRYGDKCQQFHGFNILRTNFSQNYIEKACEMFRQIKKSKRPLKNQLVAFLSLLSAYVPGSYLLESQCLKFLRTEDSTHANRSLEEQMKPFSPFIVTFQQNNRYQKRVRMAHPVIAQRCTDVMTDAGVTRSDTARNFLTWVCEEEVPPYLLSFIKDMLTKRGEKESPINNTEAEQEKFSRLILDIQNKEGGVQSASVLKVASKNFGKNPFFPQALARFFYLELKEYNQAERWAKTAKKRDPQNSFVADTLGQVYKNQLNNTSNRNPREILKLAKKATDAFNHEQELSEKEQGDNMREEGMVKVSSFFNCRGQFGYLQVCNILYEKLVQQNETWREVLTKEVSMCSVLESLGDNKLYRFNGLINSLRGEVKKKCDFNDKYLNYSKPRTKKDDPAYISDSTSRCYKRYVGYSPIENAKPKCPQLIQKLREQQADTFVGILSSSVRGHTGSELQEITTEWEKICSSKDSISALVNYILAHIMLLNAGETLPMKEKHLTRFLQQMSERQESPEHLIVALLLFWPEDTEATCVFDLSQLIQKMHSAYENVYQKYFRSRYRRPLFFLGKGQHLNRMIHRVTLEQCLPPQNDPDWQNESIFKNPEIQARLLRLDGVVRNYRVYTAVGVKEIEVEANLKNSIWKQRQVSFYLGFTVRGPVAFGIQTRTPDTTTRQISTVHGGTGATGATADPL